MEKLLEALKIYDLNDVNDEIQYNYRNDFKNPNNLPLNELHMEKVTIEMRKDIKNYDLTDVIALFDKRQQVFSALDKIWLPKYIPIYNYIPHETDTKEYVEINKKFIKTLDYLLKCNYHQFWCSVLYKTEIIDCLHSFLLNPILLYELKYLDDDKFKIYQIIYWKFLKIYKRLITHRESKNEYMDERVIIRLLIDKKLLNLPIVMTLLLIYEDLEFSRNLIFIYFSNPNKFQMKEIEETLNHLIMCLETILGLVCDLAPISPAIALDEKPKIFDFHWILTVVSYLYNTIGCLRILLQCYQPIRQIAMKNTLPQILLSCYEEVYTELYRLMENRTVDNDSESEMSKKIYNAISCGRAEFIETYSIFIGYCLDKLLECQNDHAKEEIIEDYLKLMTSALEHESFICDYDVIHNVTNQNEMFALSSSTLDTTRTDYIATCIANLPRRNRLTDCIDKIETRRKYAPETLSPSIDLTPPTITPQPTTSNVIDRKPTSDELETLIISVMEMFPHLGDLFILECLKFYDYRVDGVISAILENNLPPHLTQMAPDSIRIPTEMVEDLSGGYRGKKNDYKDTMELLNDKKDMDKIKTHILDGIQYATDYDAYDDEYDDRLDEAPVDVPDRGTAIDDEYMRGDVEAVSDTSYSEDEYDDDGRPIETKRDAFCEDPAVVRARREAKWRARGGTSRRPDVVGRAKGQGQEKNVLTNRAKNKVNKANRGNHSRKSGAQWKRNKGMLPS